MIIGSDIEKVRIFCKTPTYKNWSSLSKESKKILIDFSKKESSGDKSYKKVIKDNTSAYKHIENLESNLAALQLAIAELSTKQSVHIIETSEKIDNMVKNIQKFDRQNTHEDVMAAIQSLTTQITSTFQEYSSKLESINNQTVSNVLSNEVSNDVEKNLLSEINSLKVQNQELANNSELLSSMLLKASGNDGSVLKELVEAEAAIIAAIKSGDLTKAKRSVNKYRDSLNKAINAIIKKQEETKNKAAKVAADEAKRIEAEAAKRAEEEKERVRQQKEAAAAEEAKKKKEAEAAAAEEEKRRKEAEAAAAEAEKQRKAAEVAAEKEKQRILQEQEEMKRKKEAEAAAAAAKAEAEEKERVRQQEAAAAEAEKQRKAALAEEEAKQRKAAAEEAKQRKAAEKAAQKKAADEERKKAAAEKERKKQQKKGVTEKVNSNVTSTVVTGLNEDQQLGGVIAKGTKLRAEKNLAKSEMENMLNEEAVTRELLEVEAEAARLEAAEAARLEAEAEAARLEAEAEAARLEAAKAAKLEADEAAKASASAKTSIFDFLMQQNAKAAIETDEAVNNLKPMTI